MHKLVLLATCDELPGLDPDDQPLLGLLADRGIRARAAIWNDPDVDWADANLVVVRSTWDYHTDRRRFLRWAENLPHVANPASVLRWNTDKVYLRDLVANGIPAVRTDWVSPHESYAPPAFEHVVKPTVSAGSINTARYQPAERDASASHVSRLHAAGKTAMIQPYLSRVDDDGETGLVFIDGVFSHAFRKGPLLHAGAGLVEELYAPEEIVSREASDQERDLGEAVIDALPFDREVLLYARVDLVPGPDGNPVVIEVELTEPSLFLATARGAAERLADAIAHRCVDLVR